VARVGGGGSGGTGTGVARRSAVFLPSSSGGVATRASSSGGNGVGGDRVTSASHGAKQQQRPTNTAGAISDTVRSGQSNFAALDADAVAAAADAALETEGGFVVKQQAHAQLCTCAVCTTLRDMVNATPPPTGLEGGATAEHAHIFMSEDGGLVVGKGAQKHHVASCRCPNCNHLRFKVQAATVGGLYKFNPAATHSLKAPGFKPWPMT
jgi:hypothetical protein